MFLIDNVIDLRFRLPAYMKTTDALARGIISMKCYLADIVVYL